MLELINEGLFLSRKDVKLSPILSRPYKILFASADLNNYEFPSEPDAGNRLKGIPGLALGFTVLETQNCIINFELQGISGVEQLNQEYNLELQLKINAVADTKSHRELKEKYNLQASLFGLNWVTKGCYALQLTKGDYVITLEGLVSFAPSLLSAVFQDGLKGSMIVMLTK